MSDTYKSYLKRNLKNVVAKFGDVAILDEIAEDNLATALAQKINNKADSSDLTAVSNKVTTLIGNETGDDTKSARAIAAEEVAKIVDGADESFDTLQEIATWISTHSNSATEMNAAIVALKGKTVLGTYTPEEGSEPVEYATVKAYVEAYVAEQIASNITLASLSANVTGDGNVITAFSYDPATGAFTATKGLTAAQLSDISVNATATGEGNVLTGFTYDAETGVFTPVKGLSALTLTSLSIAAAASGEGNVVTGITYDNTTGIFTLVKGVTALTASDISGAASGDGNVVTDLSYDADTGAFTASKGKTAILEEDLVDLTPAEIDELFGITSGD